MDGRKPDDDSVPKANTQPKIKPHELLPKVRRSQSCPKGLFNIGERALTFNDAFDAVAESKNPLIKPHDGKTKLKPSEGEDEATVETPSSPGM